MLISISYVTGNAITVDRVNKIVKLNADFHKTQLK